MFCTVVMDTAFLSVPLYFYSTTSNCTFCYTQTRVACRTSAGRLLTNLPITNGEQTNCRFITLPQFLHSLITLRTKEGRFPYKLSHCNMVLSATRLAGSSPVFFPPQNHSTEVYLKVSDFAKSLTQPYLFLSIALITNLLY